jgi:hypothetical protein
MRVCLSKALPTMTPPAHELAKDILPVILQTLERSGLLEKRAAQGVPIWGLLGAHRPELPGHCPATRTRRSFLQTVVHLRALSITEEMLRNLWHIEKKLLVLLHADSTGSPTWFLDSCGATTSPKRRLLLTNYELGAEVHGKGVQLGLNFADTTQELFAGKEMGEDALRVLAEYRKLFGRILEEVKAELPQVRAAMAWAKRI